MYNQNKRKSTNWKKNFYSIVDQTPIHCLGHPVAWIDYLQSFNFEIVCDLIKRKASLQWIDVF